MKTAPRTPLTQDQIATRKRFAAATLVTCVVLAMVFGTLHVLKLGSNRMDEMRAKAGYDIKDVNRHVRAAGEDIRLHGDNETGKMVVGYTASDVVTLLKPEQWHEVDATLLIPAGPFKMGTDRDRDDDYNKPQHLVTLADYQVDKYLVTNAQYARFVVATKHRVPLHWEKGRIPRGLAMHPVTMVSWYDAAAYCSSAGKSLPTEAQWEKAARGTDGRRWPWGDAMDAQRLNTSYNVKNTTPVTQYPAGASPYGVMDMAGNVAQWTADNFVAYAGSTASADVFDAKVAQVKSNVDKVMKVVDLVNTGKAYKVLRGGSWKSDPFSTATYHRNFSWSYYASDFYGFRCVKDSNAERKAP